MPEETYEIIDGVRRAKSYELLGRPVIPAEIIDEEGNTIAKRDVPIDSLRVRSNAMIRSDKHHAALSALQQIIIRARFLAAKEEQMTKVVGLLDAAEELPRLIADEKDRTTEFAAALQAIAERYPYCRNVFVEFNSEASGSSDEPAEQLQLV